MATAFTERITVPQPAEEVWRRLTDWTEAHRWMPGVQALRAEGPDQVGTVMVFLARGRERAATISAWVPGRTVTLRSVHGPVTADYHYTCTSAATGTELALTVDLAVSGVLMRPVAPLLRFAVRRADGSQLRRFLAWAVNDSSAP